MGAPRPLDLDLLRTFVAVVHGGSMTNAAKALHRTQSATSMQMQRLEDQLQCTLLQRQRQGVSLTADGEWLLPKAQRMLQLNDEIFAERKPVRVAGLVRIGAVEHYATVVLPVLLAQFHAMYPDVQFDLQIGIPATMRPRLGADYDLVLGMGPQGIAANGGAPGTTVLARSDAVWVCSPEHDAWRQRPLPLVLQQEGSGVRAWALTALDGAGIPWRQAGSMGNLAALETAVRAGLGVGVFIARSISDRLRILGTAEGFPPLPRAETWIAKADGSASPATMLLHDFLVSAIQSRECIRDVEDRSSTTET